MQTISPSLAENRLHPSAQTHQTTTVITVPVEDSPHAKRTSTVLGSGPGRVEPVGAFEISKGKRLVQVGLAVVYCLLAGGVVFGYAALKPVMIREGVYQNKCTREEVEKGLPVCYEQEIRLNFMFTLAAVATNVCALLVGTILDRYGPRVSGVIGSVLFAVGCVGFVFAERIRSFDPYIVSYLFLALGGPFIFISSFHLSNAFPARSGLILSMLTGAFDSSSAVFLLYRVIYERTSSRVGLSRWFTAYLVVPTMILIAQLVIMPGNSYKTVGELVRQAEVEEELLDEDSEYEIDDDEIRVRREHRERRIHQIEHLLGGKAAAEEHVKQVEGLHESSGVWGAMHGKPIKKQIISWWFALITLFTIIQMTRINYFIATVRAQYEFLLHDPRAAARVGALFDVSLPLGGVLAVPVTGYLLDHLRTLTVLRILVLGSTTTGLLGLVRDSHTAALANVLLFVAYRPFYYTAVSDYAAKVFGFETFGKVYGLIVFLAGLMNLSQTALDQVTLGAFHRDPRPVNAALLTGSVGVGLALVWFIARSGRRNKRWMLGVEAESAAETLMPGGSLVGYGSA